MKYVGTGPFFTDISPAVYARHIKILLFEYFGTGWCIKLELYGNDACKYKRVNFTKKCNEKFDLLIWTG